MLGCQDTGRSGMEDGLGGAGRGGGPDGSGIHQPTAASGPLVVGDSQVPVGDADKSNDIDPASAVAALAVDDSSTGGSTHSGSEALFAGPFNPAVSPGIMHLIATIVLNAMSARVYRPVGNASADARTPYASRHAPAWQSPTKEFSWTCR